MADPNTDASMDAEMVYRRRRAATAVPLPPVAPQQNQDQTQQKLAALLKGQ